MIAYDDLTFRELEELEYELNSKLANMPREFNGYGTPEWHELQGVRFEITRRCWPL